MKGKKTYIAGPMRGYHNFNYDSFFRKSSELRERGFDVVNPAENFGGNQSLPWHVYMIRDVFQIVKECNKIVFLNGWEESEGAKFEHMAGTVMECAMVDESGMPLKPERLYSVQAKTLVYGEREGAYGHPREDFQRIAQMWNELFQTKMKPEDVALAMVAVKISRHVNKIKDDNYIDFCGYLYCYRRITEE